MDRIFICEALAKRNEIDPFLKRIVTGDEKWVTYYNIVRKRSWSKGGEAAKTVVKPGQTARKVLLCIWTPSTDQSSRRPLHCKKCKRTDDCFICRHLGTGSTSVGAPVSSRTIRKRLAEGHSGSRRPLRVLPLTPTHRRLRLVWCDARGNWTAAEWNQVVLSEEFRFNLVSDSNRVHVWRPRGECLNPAFDLQRHNTPTAGVMVWGVIAYNTRSPLVLILGTMTAQRYVHAILQPHVLPVMQRLPGALFQQDNVRPHTARV
ncbi:transposable element Tcb2 transposase [Trichonephila clavipes]|nr:transposable element Tcb2 transposase [Trichonephila clavipes]